MIDLKKLRNKKGLTQAQVGELIGCDPSTVSRYESGKLEHTPALLEKFAEIYDVSVSFILDSDIKGAYDLTTDEIDMLSDYRAADDRAKADAKTILKINRSEGTDILK